MFSVATIALPYLSLPTAFDLLVMILTKQKVVNLNQFCQN